MKAVILEEPGAVDNLVLTDIAEPILQKNEVLVKTEALSINPVDIKTRLGLGVFGRIKEDSPIILGWDISGIVIAVGEETNSFKVGDEVFGMVNFPGHGKAYAELVAVPENQLAFKPGNISHEEAAAATLAPLTALQVFVQEANIQAGQRVFIHAAAGGVGHFAVQIAKHFGAYVIGTASAANTEFLKEIGVDEPLDYTSVKFEEVVSGVDIILDSLGGEITKRSISILKPGGTLISIVGGVKEEIAQLAKEKDIKVNNYLVHSSGEDMSKLAQLLQTGEMKAHVSKVFPFTQIGEAHKQIQTGKTRGKIIIKVG